MKILAAFLMCWVVIACTAEAFRCARSCDPFLIRCAYGWYIFEIAIAIFLLLALV